MNALHTVCVWGSWKHFFFRKHQAKSIHEKFIRQCADYECGNIRHVTFDGITQSLRHLLWLNFLGLDTSKHIALIKLIYSRIDIIIETLPQGGELEQQSTPVRYQELIHSPFVAIGKSLRFSSKIFSCFKLKCLFLTPRLKRKWAILKSR